MASSPDIQIADEIVTAINAESFALNFTAERVCAVDWDAMSELDQLQVAVWSGEITTEQWERKRFRKRYRIGISFAKKVSAVPLERVDELCDLVTQVVDFLELTLVTLSNGNRYQNTGIEYVLRVDDLSLDRNKGSDSIVKYTGMFASVVIFDFMQL